MKTTLHRRTWLGCFILLWASIAPVHAFYNPTTGRWLNRDPVLEQGGKLLNTGRGSGASGDDVAARLRINLANILLQRHEARIALFNSNDPLNKHDPLGFEDTNTNPNLPKKPAPKVGDACNCACEGKPGELDKWVVPTVTISVTPEQGKPSLKVSAKWSFPSGTTCVEDVRFYWWNCVWNESREYSGKDNVFEFQIDPNNSLSSPASAVAITGQVKYLLCYGGKWWPAGPTTSENSYMCTWDQDKKSYKCTEEKKAGK